MQSTCRFEGGRWLPLSWQTREWKEMNKTLVPYFSPLNQLNQHTAAHYSQLAVLEKSDQACRYVYADPTLARTHAHTRARTILTHSRI
jgi:hypothetical protein